MTTRAPAAAEKLYVHSRPAYLAGRAFLVGYLALWHRFEAEGRENLPREGGVLLVSNHQSILDIPILAVAAKKRHVAFVARATLAEVPFLAWLMRESGCVLVRRESADRAALEAMIAHLAHGDCVAIFPEGTRTQDGSLGTFRAGAIVAARRAGVPIVPAGIRGAFEALPRGRTVPRPRRVQVRFGEPIPAGTPDALERAQAAIAAMIGDGRVAAR